MSVHTDIADAVVAQLNDASLSQDFTAVRKHRPQKKRADAATLAVTVIPFGWTMQSHADRSRTQDDYTIDVVVQKSVSPTAAGEHDEDALDELDTLFEEIAQHLKSNRRPPTYATASWIRSETLPESEAGYVREHLEHAHEYVGILRTTYRRIA